MALSMSTTARASFAQAPRPRRGQLCIRRSDTHGATFGAVTAFPTKIIKHNVPKEQLQARGVYNWPTWGCEPGSFPWSYQENEDALILAGHVIVTPEGGKPTEIKAGDFVTFPAGMDCTWDVKEAIRKHYNFH